MSSTPWPDSLPLDEPKPAPVCRWWRPWLILLRGIGLLCVLVALYTGALIGIGWAARFTWDMFMLGWWRP
jgi:hypothetical protein